MNNAHIDLEKISDSIETLSSLETLVNYRDLYSNFEEMDTYFRKINFEHANCLYYKDSLDSIYENLEYVKRKINELVDYLRTNEKSYSEINKTAEKDLLNINKQLGTSIKHSFEGNFTTIPKTEPAVENNPPINTVPIGLAIGATGIAGSIGAVIINDKYGDDEELEEYEEVFEVVETKKEKEDNGRAPAKIEEYIEPYKAVRRNREVDQYYGNQYNDIILQDDEDNETEQFDDDFYD